MLRICLLLLVSNAAAVQDMTGKVFTFPQESNMAHVKLNTGSGRSLNGLTVCHRSFTDLQRDHAIFSLATPSKINEFLMFYDSSRKSVAPHLNDVKMTYDGLDYSPNKWHSMCTTSDVNTGLVQLWFNGQPLSKKYVSSGSTITGPSISLLGQDQDTFGGGFDAKQSFVGMITDVHMWDHEISPCEIQKYMNELSFNPGNMINWAALDYETNGKVLVEDKIQGCNSMWLN